MLHDVLSERPLVQPGTIPVCPVTASQGEELITSHVHSSGSFKEQWIHLFSCVCSELDKASVLSHSVQDMPSSFSPALLLHFADYGCFSHNDSALCRFEFSILWVSSTSFYFLRCHLKITVQSALITLAVVPQS